MYSYDPIKTLLPSGAKATELIQELPEKVRITVPVAVSHSLTLSPLKPPAPVRTLLPSGEKATDQTS